MPKTKFYTSRSASNLYARCAKARYLQYHHLGTGIVKDSIYLPFLVGGCVHKGLETMLSAIMQTSANKTGLLDGLEDFNSLVVEPSCRAAREQFRAEIANTPFDLDELELSNSSKEIDDPNFSHIPSMLGARDPKAEAILYLAKEQECLVEALVAAYAYAENGLARLVAEYEILEIETEDSFLLGEWDGGELWWESRADGLLRRRVDSALVVLSFKTAAGYDMRKEDVAISDVQGMSEVVAVTRRLEEWNKAINNLYTISKQENISPPTKDKIDLLFGIPSWFVDSQPTTVEGVQMIHLLKGSQRKDLLTGIRKQDNSLIRPWIRRASFDEGDDFKFADKIPNSRNKSGYGKLGSEYSRTNLWEEAERYGCEVWQLIEAFSKEKSDETGLTVVDDFIVMPSVVRREPERLALWLKETRAQEGRIFRELSKDSISQDLSAIFPHTGSSTGACAYWNHGAAISKCPYFDACWLSRYYLDDPFSSGFKPRTPNHPGEMESLATNP